MAQAFLFAKLCKSRQAVFHRRAGFPLNQRQRIIDILLRYEISFLIDPLSGKLFFRIGDVVQSNELNAAVVAAFIAPFKSDAVIGLSFHCIQDRGFSRHIRFVYVGKRSAVRSTSLKQAEFDASYLAADFFFCKIRERRCYAAQLGMSERVSYAAVCYELSVRILRALRNGYDNLSVLPVNTRNVVKELLTAERKLRYVDQIGPWPLIPAKAVAAVSHPAWRPMTSSTHTMPVSYTLAS